MSLEAELYEERRRKWRRSAFWRGVFVTIAVLAVAMYFLISNTGNRPVGPHIARFYINDVIFDDPGRDFLLAEIANNPDVTAVILRINSPGGTTAGSEALFDSIRKISARKPVVAVMSEVGASGAYIAAIAADHVIARGNTVTGSIGVIMEYPDVTGLMETLGVEMQTIRSSDIKGGPSPFRELTEEARAKEQAMVEEAFGWFKDLVSDRRGLTGSALNSIATGGTYSGRQAIANGLIDALGGEDDALIYLESVDSALAAFPVETWVLDEEDNGLLGYLGVNLGKNPLFGGLSGAVGPRLYSLRR